MNELEKKSEVASQLTRLHRGVWGTLENDMELPIGGSILSNELTTSLKLDFSNFPEFATQEKIDELYENGRLRYEEWFAQLPAGLRSAISPREFFTLCLVQNGMEMRLGVKSEFPPETEMARTARYSSEMPLLSDFRGGISHCGERSALGQWLLQKVGIPSVYMGGVRF